VHALAHQYRRRRKRESLASIRVFHAWFEKQLGIDLCELTAQHFHDFFALPSQTHMHEATRADWRL